MKVLANFRDCRRGAEARMRDRKREARRVLRAVRRNTYGATWLTCKEDDGNVIISAWDWSGEAEIIEGKGCFGVLYQLLEKKGYSPEMNYERTAFEFRR